MISESSWRGCITCHKFQGFGHFTSPLPCKILVSKAANNDSICEWIIKVLYTPEDDVSDVNEDLLILTERY